jgi:hypothetical protein
MVGARLEERNHLLFEHEVETFRVRVDGVLDEARDGETSSGTLLFFWCLDCSICVNTL